VVARQDRTSKEIALGLLQRREHTTFELRRKLKARGVDDSEIDALLARLTELGFLDDRRAAELLVKGELRKRAVGRSLLAGRLRQRGLSSAIISEVLEPFDEAWEVDQAKKAASRWLRKTRRVAEERNALIRHLKNRGFGWSSIRIVLDCVATLTQEDREEYP
jgi:regulatory protein